jgi:hypothetical protein
VEEPYRTIFWPRDCNVDANQLSGKNTPAADVASLANVAPLVVKPKVAWKLLSCGSTHGYELLAAGELDSYLDGRSRMITVSSIHRYIARRLAGSNSQEPR